MKYTDVIIDLETTGTEAGCKILQIGAILCNVNTGEISDKSFKMEINYESQNKYKLHDDPSTIEWWKKTNHKLFKELCDSKKSPKFVGKQFADWFNNLPNKNEIRVWGNSSRFEFSILDGFYKKVFDQMEYPKPFWNTWKERCLRTLFNLDEAGRRKIPFEGTAHNALEDCRHEFKCVRYIINKFNLTVT